MGGSVLHNSPSVPGSGSGFRERVDGFLRHPAYIVLLAVLTSVFNLLALDWVTYLILLTAGFFAVTVAYDLIGLMPVVILCYIAPSPMNNPGSIRNDQSIFLFHNGWYLYGLLGILAICLLIRLVFDRNIGGIGFLKSRRLLLSGMLLLGVAYCLSGLGMPEYSEIFFNNLFFALIQFISVFLLYFLFVGAVSWDRVRRDYFAWIGLSVGFVVLIQLLENYFSGRIFMPGTDTIDRELMYTGWGMHNNIGGLLAMTIPFAFYLALTKPNGWIYTLMATIFFVGTIISCSRASMIVAAVTYVICLMMLLRKVKQRKSHIWVIVCAGLVLVAACAVFFRKLLSIFDLFFEELFLISQRDNLIDYGMKQFFRHPVFGGSFFPQGEYVPWTWITSGMKEFFPPRWHNSLVQIAASCGAVGLLAYGFHRFQTLKVLFKKPTVEKLFIGIYVFVLLVLSLFDCHFFNVGPVLLYSMALAFAEKIESSKV